MSARTGARGPVSRVACAIALTAAAALAAASLAAPERAGAREYLRAFAEPAFGSTDAAERTYWLDQSVRAGTDLLRLNVPWGQLTAGAPAAPTNPADPAYDFSVLDSAVRDATARGQRLLLTVYDAPGFAQQGSPPSDSPNGTWKPDPEALGQFAQAIATRYSGSFTPLASLNGPLPRVAYFEAWNEPNLSEYITPQYAGKKLFAAQRYREMLNAFTAGVRASGSSARVVTGGTAPYGDDAPNGRRTRPLAFLRELLCLNGKLKKAKKCKEEANFDILAHHPITLSGGPDRSAINPDDAAMPDLKHVVKTLRAAEKRDTVPGGKHPVWATEFWWETKPPDNRYGVPLNKHARWVQESLYSMWDQGADAAIWLQLVDTAIDDGSFGAQQSGLFFVDRGEKPAFTAFRFPFVVDRVSKKKVKVWTLPPADGKVTIEKKRGKRFKAIDRVRATRLEPGVTKLKLKGKAKLRGTIGSDTSLNYKVK